jgi:Tfp pilus assembly protein PilN
MALHLNLYHEIQTQNLQRKRDPFRLGMLGLLLIAIGFVGYYFYRLEAGNSINAQAARLQTDWAALEPKQKEAADREKELTGVVKIKEALMKRIEERCLWGPILDLVAQAVPQEVQITSLEASHSLQVANKPRQLSFSLSGIASGPEARKAAEDFRVSFMHKLSEKFKNVNSVPRDGFKSLEDRDEKVVLQGQSYPTAAFVVSYEGSIDLGQAPAAEPVVRVKR